MREALPATGLSVVYESETSTPLVDIVLVHGLKGHPFKTWTSSQISSAPPKLQGELGESCQTSARGKKNGLRGPISWFKKKLSAKDDETEEPNKAPSSKAPSSVIEEASPTLFWPADLLPLECPNARILCYGYDTKITKYTSGATNKNSVFSHSKDFLFALRRERALDRPLIFLAHSLGGIVVKEMLARSSASPDFELKNVVESTAAVIFLGTPHRGSPDLSSLGECARSILSALRMDTTSAILDALGLKTTDLERAQEAFSGIWQTYDFKVKTFQEGLGLMGVNLGVLGNKVVPDISSLIGDEREHAETLQANHLEMCRFTGPNDPNYRKVVGELRSMYLSIVSLNTQNIHGNGQIRRDVLALKTRSGPNFLQRVEDGFNRQQQMACLEHLRFPAMNRRRQMIGMPTAQTCDWLFRQTVYIRWLSTRSFWTHRGLLLIKGKPGAGKSTLMKEAVSRCTEAATEQSEYHVASYFFDAKGDELQRSAVGVFRSLLFQLLPHYPNHLRELSDIIDWQAKDKNSGLKEVEDLELEQMKLESFIRNMFSQMLSQRVVIFIDAIDECYNPREQLYFWRDLTDSATVTGQLIVCISSRHFPVITINDCLEITVEQHNLSDISRYVDHKFRIATGKAESAEQWNLLKTTVLEKSAGVFLWVVLVTDEVLKRWDEGKSTKSLLNYLGTVPRELETLFTGMIPSTPLEERHLIVRLFQWAILSSRPLRLHEWHHILAFISSLDPPSSLQEWRDSPHFTETDEQLERRIKNISGGLLEVRSWRFGGPQGNDDEILSVLAGAGSLDSTHGNTRIIQVIHESVREFFLEKHGFRVLDPDLGSDPIGKGHISLMSTLLDYISITELDILIQARARGRGNVNGSSHAQKDSRPSLGAEVSQSTSAIQTHRDPESCPPRTSLGDVSQSVSEQFRRAISRYNQKTSPLDLSGAPGSMTGPLHGMVQARQGQTRASAFHRLKYSSALSPEAVVNQWIGMSETADWQQSIDNLSPCTSSRLPSGSRRSMALQDHFALLTYATLSLFTHAHLAIDGEADIGPIFERLREKNTWARWVALREDLPQRTSFLGYIKQYEGILYDGEYFWYEKGCATTNLQGDLFSVASFSSASSY